MPGENYSSLLPRMAVGELPLVGEPTDCILDKVSLAVSKAFGMSSGTYMNYLPFGLSLRLLITRISIWEGGRLSKYVSSLMGT